MAWDIRTSSWARKADTWYFLFSETIFSMSLLSLFGASSKPGVHLTIRFSYLMCVLAAPEDESCGWVTYKLWESTSPSLPLFALLLRSLEQQCSSWCAYFLQKNRYWKNQEKYCPCWPQALLPAFSFTILSVCPPKHTPLCPQCFHDFSFPSAKKTDTLHSYRSHHAWALHSSPAFLHSSLHPALTSCELPAPNHSYSSFETSPFCRCSAFPIPAFSPPCSCLQGTVLQTLLLCFV